jgi:hypothetical protein
LGLGVKVAIDSAILTASDQPLPSFSQITDYVSSNRYTQVDDLTVVTSPYTVDPEHTVIPTELGNVYLDMSSLSFMIENERGYMFSSTIDFSTSGLSNNWQRRVRSAIHIYSYNTNTANNARTEEFILSENTSKTTRIIDNGFESTIRFGISRIAITLKVQFLSEGIVVEIPNESIVESGSFKIASLYVYPYLGAVKEDTIPGYMFVPDGVGALVRYPKAATTNPYAKEFYSPNLSFNTESNLNRMISEGTQLYAPVFGFVHGIEQNAMFATIESGAENGVLTINYAGNLTPYNAIFTEFIYRRIYNQPIDKAGNVITLMQENRNPIDIRIKYQLLVNEDASYVGMAKAYREQLISSNQLTRQTKSVGNIPLKLESIGLVKKDGILFADTIVMTKVNALRAMIESLSMDNIIVTYDGFTNTGASWDGPTYGGLSNRLGSAKDIEDLKAQVSALYFVTDALKASSRSGDYQGFTDLAKKINEQSYRFVEIDHNRFLIKHSKVKSSFESTERRLSKYDVDGLAVHSLGNTLYADYGTGVSLGQSIELFQTLLSESTMKIALYDAYAYLWGQMDAYFDLPMYSSQYLSFSDTVPFIPIVLKGSMDLFGSNANFYDYARDQLLRSIDYGVNLSFVVTEASSKHLQDTALRHIYTSRFTDLKPAIETYYAFVNGALSFVQGQTIESRTILQEGVVKVVYEDDTTIYVNYLNQMVIAEGRVVLPKNYIVVKQGVILSQTMGGVL